MWITKPYPLSESDPELAHAQKSHDVKVFRLNNDAISTSNEGVTSLKLSVARQWNERRKLQRNQLRQIAKEELIGSILTSDRGMMSIVEITEQLTSVMRERNEVKSVSLFPYSSIRKEWQRL